MNLSQSFLSDEIPTFEEFSSENELPTLDFQLIIDGISSIPLYERLEFSKELLSEEEIMTMNSQAEKYSSYNENIANFVPVEIKQINTEEIRTIVSDSFKDEGDIEVFLKHFFNCSVDDDIITKIKANVDKNRIFKDYDDTADSLDDDDDDNDAINVPSKSEFKISKEFSDFIYKINKGIYDNVFNTVPVPPEDSYASSEEKDEFEESKAKVLSHKLQFSKSSKSKTLEEIFEIEEFPKIRTEQSASKKPIKIQDMFQSESESETETKIKKNKETKSSGKNSSASSSRTSGSQIKSKEKNSKEKFDKSVVGDKKQVSKSETKKDSRKKKKKK